MTPTLRKYHRRIWLVLAVLLPLLFVAAVVAIPDKRPDIVFDRQQAAALPHVLEEFETENFIVRIRSNPSKVALQLEIEIKQPLTTASALVYLVNNTKEKPTDGILLGNLGPYGTHRFYLGNAPHKCILLFDAIKNRPIQTIKFKY